MERNKEAAVIYVINKFNRGKSTDAELFKYKNPVIIPQSRQR